MNRLVAMLVFGCLCAARALADSVADSLKQLEQDWGDAMIAIDTDRLSQIIAADWRTPGGVLTRERFLADLKSGRDKLESFELGPLDVKLLGDDVAVVQGSVTEKRMIDGKDRSGKFVWMDVFVKRDGKWVVVRSAGFAAN